MSTVLTKKVIDGVAPVTLADAVYMGDGTDTTVADLLLGSSKSTEYDFKISCDRQGNQYNGLCLTFVPVFGSHNNADTVNISLSMKVKVLSGTSKISYSIATQAMTGIRYDTNIGGSGGQNNVVCNKNEYVQLSYENSVFPNKYQTYTILFKYDTLGIEFEISDFIFKINGVDANYLESAVYLPSTDNPEVFICEVNYKNKPFIYNKEDIAKELMFATSENPLEVRLWGDSITAGDKATTSDVCYGNLLKTFLETYYETSVTNMGISGRFLGQWSGDLKNLSLTTKVMFIQIGTNDTSTITQTPEGFKQYYDNLSELVNTLLCRNVMVILMSATPCGEGWISSRQCKFEWVNRIIHAVANDLNVPLISNHDDLLNYCEIKGEDYNEYLFDGVHPNDKGYNWIYNNILRNLGLMRIPDATW